MIVLLEIDFIQVILIDKRKIFCLGEKDNKCILNFKYKCIKYSADFMLDKYDHTDIYFMILNIIVYFYENSYDIIMNTSYRNLILLAVKQDGNLIGYLSFDMKNDKEFVLEAVKNNGYYLDLINNNMCNDEDVVLEAIKQDSESLCYASSDNMRNNKRIVLEAVKQDDISLCYTSNNIRNNKDVVLDAVKQDCIFLYYSSNK